MTFYIMVISREEKGKRCCYLIDICVDDVTDKLEIHTMYRLIETNIKNVNIALVVWLSGLSAGLQTKGLLVQFPVGAHAWVAGQVPSWGHMRGNYTLVFLSLSFSLHSPLSRN